jgi:adenine nucleotide transporter 17
VATKAQVATPHTGILQVVQSVLREHGLLGFFRGFQASLLLCVNPAINYTVFEQLKRRLLSSTGATSLTLLQAFVLGAIGKIVATLITYPWVRAKILLQTGFADKNVCEM